VADESKPESVDRTRTSTPSAAYIVRRNDTLRKIAKAKLGDENRWREILALNKDQLQNGDALEIGMTLRMPAGEKIAEKPAENKPRARTP
jgi:nucleoid-associated protein YgaU